MNIDFLSFLSDANAVSTKAILQPAGDNLMSHAIALIGKQDKLALRDALQDHATMPDSYLSIYVENKDKLDSEDTEFDQVYAREYCQAYTFSVSQLSYKHSTEALQRYQYKDLILDGLLSGADYYYGIELTVAGQLQDGWLKGSFTTHGTAYNAPTLSQIEMNIPSDPYRLIYDINHIDMTGYEHLTPRFEVINSIQSSNGPREVFLDLTMLSGEQGRKFILEDGSGSVFERYIEYDIQVRFIANRDSPVGVSPALKIASQVQIPWLNYFVDRVILEGGGVNEAILETAAASITNFTYKERQELLNTIQDGDISSIGTAYKALLKEAALEYIKPFESRANTLRKRMSTFLYDAQKKGHAGVGEFIIEDLQSNDHHMAFSMITSPCNIKGFNIPDITRFLDGVFYLPREFDDKGVGTRNTQITYIGSALEERFFIKFDNR
ncbi:hypothetical protein CWB96_00195 [Pseudoalteromonas citrea]|uniref:Uncharacterized protein n=1 Tax=Pseudoalteromonas citrea TaxID=43655 RepID=A0A5S3XX77_9GAMM|nr:hypothetical protein [Pseudoalteromonas citrea]TMP46286.1 hypothetical protein CWB97_02190 [Pseudoalteromonas citrea]TMP63062.1 hypothetical protein CWB96_00195 [Pseudoalteromonas citrea]